MAEDQESEPDKASYLEWVENIYKGSREKGYNPVVSAGNTLLAASMRSVHSSYRKASQIRDTLTPGDQGDEDLQSADKALEPND